MTTHSIEFEGATDWTEGYVFGPGDDGEWYEVTEVSYDLVTHHTYIEYKEVSRDG